MKTVIFAGGFGTRLSEETSIKPKPMVEIGEKPILWHIMKIYASYGHTEFIICLGYKGYLIKEYFMNYFLHHSDVTIDLKGNNIEVHNNKAENFKVTLVDTGLHTKTAGRLKRVKKYLNNEPFMLTYGDGVADIDIEALLKTHKESGKIATVSSVQPAGRFGSLDIDNKGKVERFIEKPKGDGYWINAGYFVLQPAVFEYLPEESDDIMWEDYPLETLATNGELTAYRHRGFWQCMDHLRDKHFLEKLWATDRAHWKKW